MKAEGPAMAEPFLFLSNNFAVMDAECSLGPAAGPIQPRY
jgi:hypothetical protein